MKEGRLSGVVTRVATSLVLLAISATAAGFFLAGIGVIEASTFGLDGLDRFLAEDGHALRRMSLTAGAAALGVFALALILRRSPGDPTSVSGRHVISLSERGIVVVNTHSVSTIASLAVRQGSGVLGAEVRIRGTGSMPVRLLIRAAVLPGAQLPEVGQAAQVAARDAVERLAGLAVQDVHVELQMAASDDLERILE